MTTFNEYAEKMIRDQREGKEVPDLDSLLDLARAMSESMHGLSPEAQSELFSKTISSIVDESSISILLTAICFKLMEIDTDEDLLYMIDNDILEKFLQVAYDGFVTGALWERKKNNELQLQDMEVSDADS